MFSTCKILKAFKQIHQAPALLTDNKCQTAPPSLTLFACQFISQVRNLLILLMTDNKKKTKKGFSLFSSEQKVFLCN